MSKRALDGGVTDYAAKRARLLAVYEELLSELPCFWYTLPGELTSKIVLDLLDVASQYFFFQTCRKFWFGTADIGTPSYARNKRPLVDVCRAVMVHGYKSYFFELLDAGHGKYLDNSIAAVYQHSFLSTFGGIVSSDERYPFSACPTVHCLHWASVAYSSSFEDVVSLKAFERINTFPMQTLLSTPFAECVYIGLWLRPDAKEVFERLPSFNTVQGATEWRITLFRYLTERMMGDDEASVAPVLIYFAAMTGNTILLDMIGMLSFYTLTSHCD